MPSTLVIDSITGQKMRSWTGSIDPVTLLQELIPYMDNGPMEFRHSRRRATSNVNALEQVQEKALSAFASLDIKEDNQQEEAPKVVKREYPDLSEEPQGDKGLKICRVGVRLPDGRRVHRRFLQTDPIQLLWSFCCSEVKEARDGRQFRLAHAVPGASSGTLEYSSNLSFGDSGLSNSLVSMTWD
jgi:hypothetical protein